MSGNALTISITYYDEPHWLQRWLTFHGRLQMEGLPVHFQVIDDGSPIHPAIDYLRRFTDNVSLYRVTKDVGFNSHGCRNLAMKVAPTPWVLLSDIDRGYSIDVIKSIVDDITNNRLKSTEYYAFKETNWVVSGWSVNEFLVHKAAFGKTGGYDEELVNIHYGDRLFLENLEQFATRVEREDWPVKYLRSGKKIILKNVDKTEYIGDMAIVHPPKFWVDKQYRHNLISGLRARNQTPSRLLKRTIQFPWRKEL